MDPPRQSLPEAGVYRMLRVVLVDLTMAGRALAIRAAIAQLERFGRPPPR